MPTPHGRRSCGFSVAVLDFAAGGEVPDPDGSIVVAVQHFQFVRLMVEVSLGVREALCPATTS